MKNLPRLTKLKAQKAAPMIVAHVKELLAPLDLQASKQYTIKVKTNAEPFSNDERQFWRYQSRFTLEFCKALEEVLPTDVSFMSYNHLTNDLTVVRQ
tara:strand:- start:575 stop:865 length:291 start_codon:yes stop_codon:yes gene_type:complete